MNSRSRLLLTLLSTACSLLNAVEPPGDRPELSALWQEYEKRTGEALRPVYMRHENELGRLERSATTRGNLDTALAARKERERFKADQAQLTQSALRTALEDTRWKFNGEDALQIVFKKDGFFDCAAWERAGYAHRWQIGGPSIVIYTVLRGPSTVGKQGSLVFAPDSTSCAGTTPEGQKIIASSRLK